MFTESQVEYAAKFVMTLITGFMLFVYFIM